MMMSDNEAMVEERIILNIYGDIFSQLETIVYAE